MIETARARMIQALSALQQAFDELEAALEAGVVADIREGRVTLKNDSDLQAEYEAQLVGESRVVVESVLEDSDWSTDDLASVIATLTDALEEIDPDLFEDVDEP